MAHLNINIVELKIIFNGLIYYFETTATPDRVYLTDFNNSIYINRFLTSHGNPHLHIGKFCISLSCAAVKT